MGRRVKGGREEEGGEESGGGKAGQKRISCINT